jgi:hypothetical protein
MRGVSKVGAQGLAATWSVEVVCSWPSRLLKREALSLELQHRTLRQSVILSQGYTPRVQRATTCQLGVSVTAALVTCQPGVSVTTALNILSTGCLSC